MCVKAGRAVRAFARIAVCALLFSFLPSLSSFSQTRCPSDIICPEGTFCSTVLPGKCVPNDKVDCGSYICDRGERCGGGGVCYPVTQRSEQSEDFLTFPNRDLPGNDLRITRNSTHQSCAAACTTNTECHSYTFDRWNNVCILKNGISELRLNPKSTTGVRSTMDKPSLYDGPTRIDRYRGKSFPGKPYRSQGDSTLEACEGACAVAQSCLAYTFVKSAKLCNLFDDTGEYFPNRDADSGVKVQ